MRFFSCICRACIRLRFCLLHIAFKFSNRNCYFKLNIYSRQPPISINKRNFLICNDIDQSILHISFVNCYHVTQDTLEGPKVQFVMDVRLECPMTPCFVEVVRLLGSRNCFLDTKYPVTLFLNCRSITVISLSYKSP